MGVRTLLTAYQNRSDGPKFEVWEEANGKVQAYQNGSPLVAAETNPLTGGRISFLLNGEEKYLDAVATRPDGLIVFPAPAGGGSLTINLNNIPDNTDLQLLGPLNVVAATSGLTYALTATPAVITGAASLVIPEAGSYVIDASMTLSLVGATFAANQAVTALLRRTNNTAADIQNSSASSVVPVMTTTTLAGNTVHLRTVMYTTSNSDDAIAIYASVSALPSAGSIQVTGTNIIARRV